MLIVEWWLRKDLLKWKYFFSCMMHGFHVNVRITMNEGIMLYFTPNVMCYGMLGFDLLHTKYFICCYIHIVWYKHIYLIGWPLLRWTSQVFNLNMWSQLCICNVPFFCRDLILWIYQFCKKSGKIETAKKYYGLHKHCEIDTLQSCPLLSILENHIPVKKVLLYDKDKMISWVISSELTTYMKNCTIWIFCLINIPLFSIIFIAMYAFVHSKDCYATYACLEKDFTACCSAN